MEIKNPLDRILHTKCIQHPNQSCELLQITPNTASHLICLQCVFKGKVSLQNSLEIKSLFENEEYKILHFYPPLNDSSIYERLEKIQQFSIDEISHRIETFIINLKRDFYEILENIKKESKQQLQKLAQRRIDVLDMYNEVCEKDALRDAVLGLQSEQGDNNITLHGRIAAKCKDSKKNTEKLQEIVKEFEDNLQGFSMDSAENAKVEILDLLSNISFWTSENKHPKLSVEPSSLVELYPVIFNKKPISKSILKKFQLLPSSWFDSASRISIERMGNDRIDVKCIQANKYCCVANSQSIIDKEKFYTFRFEFHQDSTEPIPQFMVGLLNEADKDNSNATDFLRYCEHQSQCKINKIIKGVALHSSCGTSNLRKEIEMRVHLASRTLKVADYPKYNNVVELADKNKIIKEHNYVLQIIVGYQNNHITLTEALVSDRFDGLM